MDKFWGLFITKKEGKTETKAKTKRKTKRKRKEGPGKKLDGQILGCLSWKEGK